MTDASLKFTICPKVPPFCKQCIRICGVLLDQFFPFRSAPFWKDCRFKQHDRNRQVITTLTNFEPGKFNWIWQIKARKFFCAFDDNENYHHPSCDDFVGLKCFCIRLTKEMFPFGVQHIKLGLQVGAAMQRQLSCIDMIWQCCRESCRIMSIIVDEQIYEIWCHQLNSWRVVNVDCGTS